MIKKYIVTLRYQYPAWDEKSGLQYEVSAENKSDAIKIARWNATTDGQLCGGKGRVSFKAQEYCVAY